jgi:hypothetical protein
VELLFQLLQVRHCNVAGNAGDQKGCLDGKQTAVLCQTNTLVIDDDAAAGKRFLPLPLPLVASLKLSLSLLSATGWGA